MTRVCKVVCVTTQILDQNNGILTIFPFDTGDNLDGPIAQTDCLIHEFIPRLRIDSLIIKCCSHETFLHFGPQGSRLNICYYHQDLH